MRGYVLILLYALLLGDSKGEKCVCTSFWECSTTGGSPIAYCGQDTNEVCCVYEELAQDNTLNGEEISAVTRAEPTKTSGDLPLEKPPPPVRLFGDRKVKPIVNTALRNAIPVRLIRIKNGKLDGIPDDRGSLDAFPRNLVSTPDIIDPLRRRQQQANTKADAVPSSNPMKISGKSLTFRVGADPRPVTDESGNPTQEQSPLLRIPAALSPLIDARLRSSIDASSRPQPSQIGGPVPSLVVSVGPLETGQNAFSFADSSSSSRRTVEPQPNIQRTSQFSFRDTRP